jgi:hypothetical protein
LIGHDADLSAFSTQTEERENEHDHHDQADQIDEAVHGRLHDIANVETLNTENSTGMPLAGSCPAEKLSNDARSQANDDEILHQS